ncbi:hypothetical protein PMKS-001468 [Pichia membranifaciens]|uniref:Uncharacterized protein n=1 Tax=Pichia membranifaciens TaxID=4926 RepID=A0A1Q2YEL8_9ASCO|nr:hypothetical protein PMKS-001468 [Pichia membranifaciens]
MTVPRRDPTTIHLVAEDIKDIGQGANYGIIQQANIMESGSRGKFDLDAVNHDNDNQNWDSSLDESYLGSRSRERDTKRDTERDRANVGSKEREQELSQGNINNSLLRTLADSEGPQDKDEQHNSSGIFSKPFSN